jgi:hypothetical protein
MYAILVMRLPLMWSLMSVEFETEYYSSAKWTWHENPGHKLSELENSFENFYFGKTDDDFDLFNINFYSQ